MLDDIFATTSEVVCNLSQALNRCYLVRGITKFMAKAAVTIQYCGGWNYGPAANSLKKVLEEEFAGDIDVQLIRDPGVTGNFEVVLVQTGELIHSKKSGGKGKCESDKERGTLIATLQDFIDSQ